MAMESALITPVAPAGAVRFGDTQLKELEERILLGRQRGDDVTALEGELKRLAADLGSVSNRTPGVRAQTSALVPSRSSALV